MRIAFVLRWIAYRELVWTEDSEDHIARRDVRPGEVDDAVNGRPVRTRKGRNGTTELYGTTTPGRHLVVILASALDGRWYVVTARQMNNNEKRAFQRKGR